MELSDFNYNLPEELIAQKAVVPKDHSRLMVVNSKIEHKHFYDIVNYLKTDDILAINETKVSKAKICGRKITGSKVEIILTERIDERTFGCRIKANKVKAGNSYEFEDGLRAELISQEKDMSKTTRQRPCPYP